MSGQSLIERYDVFFAGATIGAHANALKSGFRQRDVKFLIEFFVNWVDPRMQWEEMPVQNTHISRYLDLLVSEGYARKLARKGHPRYRLTRSGIIESIQRMVGKPYYSDFEMFFFTCMFIENYTPRAFDMVAKEGSKFPYALRVEIESILDLDAIIDKQLEFAKRELKIIEERIATQIKTKALVEELLESGIDTEEIFQRIERTYPYSLNTKKPMSEFLAEGTVRQSFWELTEGGMRRNAQLWEPARERLLLHIQQLKHLREGTHARAKSDNRLKGLWVLPQEE